MKITKIISVLSLLILFSGCSSQTRIDHVPINQKDKKRDLVVFFDGTANDEGSHTNVAKLHNLVTLQNKTNISTTYIKGVGTGAKLIGMAAGWGIGNDVREAYSYLLENYDSTQNDQISIFGFSRGAYAARILAALLNVAGIPNTKNLTTEEREDLAEDIYHAYKCRPVAVQEKNPWIREKNNKHNHHALCSSDNQYTVEERRVHVAEITASKWQKKISYIPSPIHIRFMGLWDTVAALGLPDFEENIDEPNERYADQLCNIDFAAHALALDDDRSRIFTPLLLTRKHLRKECNGNKENNLSAKDVNYSAKVDEVWFSGAHSDVGGGYEDTDIDGVSLNWMLDEMEKNGLLLVPKNTEVYSDYLGKTHNPDSGLFDPLYHRQNRNIPCYTDINNSGNQCLEDINKRQLEIIENIIPNTNIIPEKKAYTEGSTSDSRKIKIHQSVLDRLCIKTPENYESFWFKHKKYKNCLTCDFTGKGILNDTDSKCKQNIEIVSNTLYEKQYEKRQNKLGDITCNYDACPKANDQKYQVDKACNFDHEKIKIRAKQRLSNEEVNGTKTIVIYADVKNDRTGIYMSKNKSYTFKIDKIDTWVDCTTNATPFNGRPTWSSDQSISKNPINIFGKSIAYSPFSGYMELLGVVGTQQFELGKMAENGHPFSPKEDGELIIRINEPRCFEQVYENNSGILELTITLEKNNPTSPHHHTNKPRKPSTSNNLQ